MKRGILFFALVCFTTVYSQEKQVKFQTELSYTIDRKENKWYLSKQNPELILIENKTIHFVILNDSLYQIEFNSSDEDAVQQPGSINYTRTKYNKERKKKRSQTFLKTDDQKNIHDLSCTKFVSKVGNQTYEVYIALNHKVDNTGYVKNLIGSDEPIGVNGLVAEINIQAEENEEFRPFLKLTDVKKVERCLYIDYSKIKESISFLPKPRTEYSIVEEEPTTK